MNNYKAILFHPEGDYVTDFTDIETTLDVWNEIADMGSRWVFYPLPFVATDKRIVSTLDEFEFLKGKSIKTAVKYFKDTWNANKDEITKVLNEGGPLWAIYG